MKVKVKEIVDKTTEYERLQGLINSIRSTLDKIEKVENDKESESPKYILGSFNIGSFTIATTTSTSYEQVDIYLNRDIFWLIKDKIKDILEIQLKALEQEQNELEIEEYQNHI